MHRSRASFAHAFRAAVAMGRRGGGVAILDLRDVHRGDWGVVAEGAGEHVADGVIDTGFHERRTDTVRGRAIDLPFHDPWIDDRTTIVHGHIVENLRDKRFALHFHERRTDTVRGRAIDLPFHDPWIDDRTTIVHGHIVENLRDKRFALHFDDCDVQLRGVGQRETAVFCFKVWNLERGAPYVAAVECDVVQFGREHGAIHVDNVGEAPVVDGFPVTLCLDLGPLLADSEFEIVFFRFENKGGQSPHFSFEFLRGAVNRRQTRNRKLAGVRTRHPGVHVALGIEACAHGDQVGMNIEHVGYDLRRGGFVSLALRTRTDGHYHFTVDIELAVRALRVAGERRVRVDDLRLAEIVGSRIERGADANADHAA